MTTNNNLTLGAINSLISDIDDWCGTGPKPWPRPKKDLRDMLVAIAIHRIAGELSDSKLSGQIQKLAESQFDIAIKQAAKL